MAVDKIDGSKVVEILKGLDVERKPPGLYVDPGVLEVDAARILDESIDQALRQSPAPILTQSMARQSALPIVVDTPLDESPTSRNGPIR